MKRALSSFEILPAIDLRGGRVVRLRAGDFDRETVYGDAVSTARRFAAAGVRRIHVVDLDGARAGEPRQLDLAARMAGAVGPGTGLELGGGLRDDVAVQGAFDAGIDRVVLGTAVLDDPALLRRLVDRHGTESVAVAIDVREGRAVGHAWVRGTAPGPRVADAVTRLEAAGATVFEVTAIDRDGLLSGPDLALLGMLVGAGRRSIVASGGIRSIGDLRAVRDLGCRGAIVGRAVYEGTIDLASAIRAL